jgi:type II secretory pathway pseudopilin PulG
MKTDLNAIGRHDRDRRNFEPGFTLTELLVVIACLILLAALGLPALARTDDNSTRVVCLHNLRQMAMAMNMYAGDNRDYLASPNWDGGSGATAPRGWLYGMNNQGLPPNSFPTGECPDPYRPAAPYNLLPNGPLAWQTGLWYKYINNFKSYLCPVDIESRDYLPPASVGGRNNKLSSYVMNGAVTGFPSSGFSTPCKLTDVWNPACYLLWEPDENAVGPGNPGAFEYNDGSNYPDQTEGTGRLHSANGGNMLCVGGNVEFVTVQTWNLQSVAGSGPGPGGRTLAWWAVGNSAGNSVGKSVGKSVGDSTR